MKEQPAVDIEINFDLDFEEFGLSPEMADARHIKVTVEDEEILDASLILEAPEGGSPFCPVKLRGTPVYTKLNGNGVVTFRAELDLTSIEATWSSVEEAAKEPRFFVVKVKTRRNGGARTFTRKRRGRLKINLNSIRWEWQPLERKDAAPAKTHLNEPIEITIDGTGDHGFKLHVERWVKQPDGEYVPREADFTHYIAPDGKADFTILGMVPPPWELEKARDGALFHQPDTEWWAKELKADHPILAKLPLSTSIRVQAWPYDKIARRFPNTFEPKTLGRYAIREIPLNLIPALEIVVKFEPDGERSPGDIKLEKNEFIADNEDELKVVAYVRRKNIEPEQIVEKAEIEIKMDPEDPEYELETKPSETERGKIIGTLRSTKPLLYVQKRAGTKLKLKITAKIKQPDGGMRELEPVEKEVKPRFLFVKLWVVPGAVPGTSEAGVFVCVEPKASRARVGQLVEIVAGDPSVSFSQGGGGGPGQSPSSDGMLGTTSNLITTAPPPSSPQLSVTGSTQMPTIADGTVVWDLRYTGMTWDNLSQGQFKVACRLRSKRGNVSDATFARIDVRQNMNDMIVTLSSQQAALRLTNPARTERFGEWVLPNSFRGPAYNIYNLVCGGPDEFTCGALATRIYDWWASRRFDPGPDVDPEPLACMNGIEIAKYTLSPIHVFAGCYPSGGDIMRDPWMIDPWWRQEWGDHTLLSWSGEIALLGDAMLLLGSPFIVPMLAKLMVAGAAGGTAAAVAAIKAWLVGSKTSIFCSTVFGAGTVGGVAALEFYGYKFRMGIFNGPLDNEWFERGRYKGYTQPIKRVSSHWRKQQKVVGFVTPVEP